MVEKTSLFLISICLFVAGILADEEHMDRAHKGITLKDVCANRQVPIIQVEDIFKLVRELNEDIDTCLESYKQSFYEMIPVLTLSKTEKLCSEKKFQQILEYHFRYINPKQEVYNFGDNLHELDTKIVKRPLDDTKVDYTVQLDSYKQEIMIPIALQQFFKAWALQVSGLCKRALVDNLRLIDAYLNEDDIKLIKQFAASGKGTMNPILKKPIADLDFNSVVYMPELEGEVQQGDLALRNEVTVLDLRSNPELNKFMHACQFRFKPVYEKLVMPVVRLAKLGYDYHGSSIETIRSKLQSDPEIIQWLSITSICESIGNLQLVEDETSPIVMTKIVYEPVLSYAIASKENLWIKGAEALRKEFFRASGHTAKGFDRFAFKLGQGGKKFVAFIDPHQFAWYRRNQNTLSSFLNTLSIMSNSLSLGVSFAGRR